jgi:hypothetical protein
MLAIIKKAADAVMLACIVTFITVVGSIALHSYSLSCRLWRA